MIGMIGAWIASILVAAVAPFEPITAIAPCETA
jgi:hypothetical protein